MPWCRLARRRQRDRQGRSQQRGAIQRRVRQAWRPVAGGGAPDAAAGGGDSDGPHRRAGFGAREGGSGNCWPRVGRSAAAARRPPDEATGDGSRHATHRQEIDLALGKADSATDDWKDPPKAVAAARTSATWGSWERRGEEEGRGEETRARWPPTAPPPTGQRQRRPEGKHGAARAGRQWSRPRLLTSYTREISIPVYMQVIFIGTVYT
ncbi:hypothetical protein BS78_05G144300 [Paspalum vaginatum]|nr:hypothetical protein BS78_05G144300 [Paspalum vaginatum]